MESTLVLYRGDYKKIREFNLNKTNKRCLVGQGIYLTDSLKVAQTYRTKGSYRSEKEYLTLVDRSFPTKGAALEEAFQKYMAYTWKKEHGTEYDDVSASKKAQHRLASLASWEDLLRVKKVTIETQRHLVARPAAGSPTGIPTIRLTSLRHQLQETHRESVTTYTIKLRISERTIGRISVFAFDNENGAFDNKVVNLSKCIMDKRVRETMAGIPYFNPLSVSTDEYVERFIDIAITHELDISPGDDTSSLYARHHSMWQRIAKFKVEFTAKEAAMRHAAMKKGRTDAYNKLAKRLLLQGYRGFEYSGGLITAGIRHRAFSLWDDEFVNNHFIERMC